MVDNATGKVEVWRIKDLKKEEVPKEQYGQFFSGDSYIVLYSYKKGTKSESSTAACLCFLSLSVRKRQHKTYLTLCV
jgi:hypothetical protein